MDRRIAVIGLGAHIVTSACYNPTLAPDGPVSATTGAPDTTTGPPPDGSTSETPSGSTETGTMTDGPTGGGMSGTSTIDTSTPMTSTTAADPGTTAADPGVCGDGMVDPGEECDAGPMNGVDGQACTSNCVKNICGDGHKGAGEACDDGNKAPDDGCSQKCVAESCGDGVIQAGEQCDDTSESATCDSDCSAVSCGDGTLNMSGGENCDDGNNTDTDACAACEHATCGDGFVRAGVEQCDDGNVTSGDGCTATCKSELKRVFVSSALYNGNLGGLVGADVKCQTLAAAAGLPGTYFAWLSTSMATPASRFSKVMLPYVTVTGTKIADNWTDLTDGTLDAPLDVTESGGAPPPGTVICGEPSVWSNTWADGTMYSADNSCSDWTSLAGGSLWGQWTAVSSMWSDWCQGGKCSWVAPIYCFEQ